MPRLPDSDTLRHMGRHWVMIAAALAATLMIGAGAAYAQRYFREGSFALRPAPEQMPDASFVVCRLAYRSVRSEPSGIGWRTDYPYAEINLTTRLSELTRTRVSRSADQQPNFYVVRPLDATLFNCPLLIASDAGTIGFTEPEAEQMRRYLLKGGFFWADDFWGTAAWEHWSSQIARVLPREQFPIEDIPLDDPMLHSLFDVKAVPQITNIQFWRGSGGRETSERGADSAQAHLRVIRDSHKRIMVVMTHNTDVADSWEREGEDPAFFLQFSPAGYALGIDVLLHAMMH